MRLSAFDLSPIFMKRYDFFGYVILDDRRFERVLSDETHRILTRILNHYVAKNKPSRLTDMVKKLETRSSATLIIIPSHGFTNLTNTRSTFSKQK